MYIIGNDKFIERFKFLKKIILRTKYLIKKLWKKLRKKFFICLTIYSMYLLQVY